VFKTKTKTFLWCILEADRKAFSFSAINENTDENEIPFTAENETKIHSFSAEKRKWKSPDNISVFSVHTFSHQVSPRICRQYLVQFRLFGRWSLLTGFHFPHVQCIDIFVAFFSRWHFNQWTVCFPGLLLLSESNFPLCFTGVCVA